MLMLLNLRVGGIGGGGLVSPLAMVYKQLHLHWPVK